MRATEPPSIRDAAAQWLLRWHAGDLSVAERFEYLQWLKISPVHIAETLRACRLYCWLDQVKPLRPFEHDECVTEMPLVHLPGAAPEKTTQSAGRLFVRMRNLTAIAAMISVGIGTFNMSWGVVHETNFPAENLFRALPLLGPAATVALSIFAFAVGATIGLRSVKRGALR